MNVIDFFETYPEMSMAFEDMNLDQLKDIQRMLTIAINNKQGYDGGKELRTNQIIPIPTPVKINGWEALKKAQACERAQVNFVSLPKGRTETIAIVDDVITEEDKNMNQFIETIEGQQKAYLKRRLDRVEYEKRNALRKDFFIEDDDTPSTPAELKARFDSGNFILPDPSKPRHWSEVGNALAGIIWRNPANKANPEGYKAAVEKVEAAAVPVKDIIMTKDANAGLEALKAFEATPTTTFH